MIKLTEVHAMSWLLFPDPNRPKRGG
jgi:hypothetical protein